MNLCNPKSLKKIVKNYLRNNLKQKKNNNSPNIDYKRSLMKNNIKNMKKGVQIIQKKNYRRTYKKCSKSLCKLIMIL